MAITDPRQDDEAPSGVKGIMPPYLVLHDFLDGETVDGLLAHSIARRTDFAPTQLGGMAVNPEFRFSLGLRDLGPYRAVLKHRVLGLLPRFIADLRVAPIKNPGLELELVAHGDGAFYKRHIDTRTANQGNQVRVRELSGVYYFHAMPKAFRGGALRLYQIGDQATSGFVDIEPEHNSFLVFPSWAPHEVMPVSCPSKKFIDSRFAINCWLYRKPTASNADAS